LAVQRRILVGGAGVLGLWQALVLSERGFAVTLCDTSAMPDATSASRYAGAMLAPWCEAESAPDIVRDVGIGAMSAWRAVLPGLVEAGSLVVAPLRDRAELDRFARQTTGFERIGQDQLAELEPDLAGRFNEALFFPDEAHMATDQALSTLAEVAAKRGVRFLRGMAMEAVQAGNTFDFVIDCRGLAARNDLPGLRGVRGERLLVRARDVSLSRPVRLLHPRHPIYIVPWPEQRFVIGATVIESEETGPASVRSTLELLGAAYALHPAFGEGEILDIGAGVRPAFPDNVPKVIPDKDGLIQVNGAYRHGFLLAPALAEAVAGLVVDGDDTHPLVASDAGWTVPAMPERL